MSTVTFDKKIVSWKLHKEKQESFAQTSAPKRLEKLPCSINQVKVKGESWTILVSVYQDKPYEVFGGLSKFIEIPKKYKTGVIVKNGKKDGITTYNLICGEDEDLVIKDIVNVFENTTHGAFTRLMSLALRHGTPINFLVDQLQKDQHSDITSFSRVVARVLKTYIKDGTKTSASCPECKSTDFIFEAGCNRCLSCGHSKCL